MIVCAWLLFLPRNLCLCFLCERTTIPPIAGLAQELSSEGIRSLLRCAGIDYEVTYSRLIGLQFCSLHDHLFYRRHGHDIIGFLCIGDSY